MSTPPPPPPSQPPGQPPFHNYPPQGGSGSPGGGSGGFGPPGGGGFGPPAPGGWPPPPPPPPRDSRRTVVAIVVAAVVAVALTAGAVAVFRGGDDDKEPTAAGTATPTDSGTAEGREPAPSDSATEEFPDDDLTDGLPTDDYPTDEESPRDFEDIMPTPSDGPRPAYQMEVGDCFDLPEGKQGQGDPVECSAAHDAEVVHQEKLAGEYDTDAEVRKKADAVCKIPMKDAAEGESSVGGTLVQYPKSTGVSLGMRTVTCSLTAGEGKKLYKSIS